jgi:HEAT repeat protein
LRNRYVLLIISLFAASMVSYFVLDNAFYTQAERQYASEQQLASFIGIFFGVAGLLGLLCRTFFTAQLLGRYGVRVALLFQPVLLMLIAVPATMAGSAGLLLVLFWLVASMKLISAVLADSVDLPALNITYQPLPAHQRVQVQTLTEGIVYALAIGAAGVTLSISTRLLPSGSVGLVSVLMAILLAWMVLAVLVGREYPKRMLGAMRRRRLGPTELLWVDDGDTIAMLQRELLSTHLGAVLYAMDTLEAAKPEALIPALPILLDHHIPEVRQEVLQRIDRLGLVAALPAVSQRVDEEPLPAIRGFAVRTLAVLGRAEAFEYVAAFLEDPEPHLRQGALVGLLKSGIEGSAEARQVLGQMAGSAIPSERALAARVLGEAGLASLYDLLLPLLHDGNPEVERAALWAAARVQTPRLWPLVLDKLGTPGLVRAATAALVAAGPPVLPELRAAFVRPGQSPAIQARLVQIAGRIGGEAVVPWLVDQLSHPDAGIRSHVVRALHRCDYRAVAEEAPRVQGQIRAEVARSAETWATRVDLGDEQAVQLLREALHATLDQDRERVFYLLSFLCDRRAVLQARDNLALPSAEKRAYAREVVDLLAAPSVKGLIIPLLSDQPESQKLRQVRGFFPQPQRSRRQRLEEIATGPSARYGAWTRTCALYAIGALGKSELASTVAASLSAEEPLVRETAVWALARLDGAAYCSEIGNMIHDSSPQVARFAGQWATGDCQEETMLSTVEKVLALKRVDVFAGTPDETLAAVAGLLEELPLSAGQAVFDKGDLGDCLYLIVQGEVRVHDGEQTLNHLVEGDVFGEMALLDAEPRMASVTAVEETLLLRLAQEPFFELMEDRPEVARGMIRVLSHRLRARSRELTELRACTEEGQAGQP